MDYQFTGEKTFSIIQSVIDWAKIVFLKRRILREINIKYVLQYFKTKLQKTITVALLLSWIALLPWVLLLLGWISLLGRWSLVSILLLAILWISYRIIGEEKKKKNWEVCLINFFTLRCIANNTRTKWNAILIFES